ncbi:MAG: circularly permuted type 2 ATP-grasp protein, partial [Brachybacterium sp.]|nr:circularly permuted type 2 ATP-grasp protein [Brachybacterium sp.]
MTSTPPHALADELAALGPRGRRRAATSAATMFAADVPTSTPRIDPVPAILDAEAWSELSAGLVQRMRLLDALCADLYGPRTVLGADVAPVAELLQDPAYLRTAIGIPSRGNHSLFALTSTVARTADGSWVVLEDEVDVPDGAGTTLELRRVLSRCAPTLYRSTPLRRLHPFFDTIRTSLHQRTRSEGRSGRTVVLTEDSTDPMRAFDHSWLANLLGAPMVSVGDLRSGSGTLTLRLPGLESDPGDAVDALLRLVPSRLLDPLDLGPTPLGGVTGLVEAARCGDVEIFNPIGAGLLENPDLRAALPDLCRQLFHEDLLLRPAEPGFAPAGWLSMDPSGDDELVDRPMVLRLLVMGTEDGYEVLPGGVGVTADDGPEALKDVWVTVPETSAVPAEGEPASGTAEQAPLIPRGVLTAYPAMTRSIGSDLFWFGRYLERVDSTA